MPKPVAIVAHTHPSVTKGGGEIAAYALYQGLRDLGVPAIFIAACPLEDRDRVTFGSDDEYLIFTERARYDEFYQLASADIWRQLKAILLGCGARLVNFHHYINVGMNSLRGLATETPIPFVVTFHEFMAICANQGQMVKRRHPDLCEKETPDACAACFPEHSEPQFVLRKQLMRSALLPATAYVAPSRFLADRLSAWGLPAAKFSIIENGLRALPLCRAPPRPHTSSQPWVFGYFGQITPYKGVDTILDAVDLLAARLASAQRIEIRIHGGLAGQTPEFVARFHAVIARHDFVDYAGPYANTDIFARMAACDYVLVPSTWWENSPVVIQEAFAAGRPVICTGIGGMAEKVPEGIAGLHIGRADAADLVHAMCMAADPNRHARLVAGLPRPQDQTAMARSYLALFNGVLLRERD